MTDSDHMEKLISYSQSVMLKIRLIEVYRLMKVRRRYHEHSIDTCRRNRRASYARQAETVRISAGENDHHALP